MRPDRNAPPIRIPKVPTPVERIPRRVFDPTADDYLHIMTRAIFQAGLSWAMIDARWDAYVQAFDRFAVARVAAYGEADVERLMTTDHIVHSARKIEGTIHNARALVSIEREYGHIAAYIAHFERYANMYADVRARFAFMGDLNCYYWLFRTGNPVPVFETWIAAQPKDHPRMREMVLAGRAAGTSTERAGY